MQLFQFVLYIWLFRNKFNFCFIDLIINCSFSNLSLRKIDVYVIKIVEAGVFFTNVYLEILSSDKLS